MCLLGGRDIFSWLGVPCGKQESVELPPPSSPSSRPIQRDSQKEVVNEEEERPFEAADKSDSHILKLTKTGLKSLNGKLEVVIVAKKESDSFFYWEFPLLLSQSKLGGRSKPSNACTLISMSIAEELFNNVNLSNILRFDQRREGFTEGQQIAMNWYKVCPPELIRLMKDAITKGNKIYDEEKKRKKDSVFFADKKLKDILTIPEAITARNRFVMGGSGAATKDHSVMNEVDFIAVRGSLKRNLWRTVSIAIDHPSVADWEIFCFIVICCEKAVSLVYRKDSDLFCLLDSHAHDNGKTGAIIAVSSRLDFPQMAQWMEKKFFNDQKDNGTYQKFELSFLQLTNDKAISPLNPNTLILSKIFHPSKSSPIKSKSSKSPSICHTQSSVSTCESGYDSEEIPSN